MSRFDTLPEAAPDKIIALMQMYRDDPRPEKVDLGVGVFKNADGNTPVMRAVKAAENRLIETQDSKSYVSMTGDPAFLEAVHQLVLGDAADRDRTAHLATVGGTGAIHQAMLLIRRANPDARVWISDPSWPNHVAIARHLGLPAATYRYFDPAARAVDFGAMLADLEAIPAGDVLLLHGCCHNPTGASLTLTQWQEVTALMARRGIVPLIDLAYQGFGDGVEEDTAGLRHAVAALPDALVAVSGSKNFGLYRERAGALYVQTATADARAKAQANLFALNRLTYSFPPDHGARLMTMVLNDPALKADWQDELTDMRNQIRDMRALLANTLQRETGSDRFGFLTAHQGMFSMLGTTLEQVQKLRSDFGIYMTDDGRINVAGLSARNIPYVAGALRAVGL